MPGLQEQFNLALRQFCEAHKASFIETETGETAVDQTMLLSFLAKLAEGPLLIDPETMGINVSGSIDNAENFVSGASGSMLLLSPQLTKMWQGDRRVKRGELVMLTVEKNGVPLDIAFHGGYYEPNAGTINPWEPQEK